MRALERQRRDWEDLATVDCLWSILRHPSRRERWELDEFFATGEHDVERILGVGAELGLPVNRERALDFGCGVGRLSRALAKRFSHVEAVDISHEMIERARGLNTDAPNIRFVHNVAADLERYGTGSFDLVCAILVLQHLPSEADALRYVEDFVRVLGPGGLAAFQLPSEVPPRRRLQLRRRAYSGLRSIGFSERWLYRRLGLDPIRTLGVPEGTVSSSVVAAGGRLVRVERDDAAGPLIPSRTYYASPVAHPLSRARAE